MKWFWVCAVLLGFTVPAYGQDAPEWVPDALELEYKAMFSKHMSLAVRDVLSKEEAFDVMVGYGECSGLLRAGGKYVAKIKMPNVRPEDFEKRSLAEHYWAMVFWKGYSVQAARDVEDVKERAETYYGSLLEAEGEFSKEVGERSKECIRYKEELVPARKKINKIYRERATRDPATKETFLKMEERRKRDYFAFGELEEKLGMVLRQRLRPLRE